ncbi:hypothetical protein J2X02_000830 [Pseudoxanthomonas japonensis]|uniref:hypothetical protein n=1 Tax=Pseudoxanthomonas japonensis TaxID=69284 RepID=UPI001A5528D8|nr:hypothetical protein [Pseudoxanthomonas japonensis]MBL8257004.1 hypothetical protein [Pseudoxanthomonas mexicana]MDR7068013.1 hypothetical protein [Pseudoxanthomonas japonensis]
MNPLTLHLTTRHIAIAFLVVGMGAASIAHAQWRVVDNAANTKLQDMNGRIGTTSANGNGNGTVNGNLRELYQQQVFESFNGNNDDSKAAPEPEEKLQHAQPTRSGVNMNADNRCKQASSGIAQQQYQLCREIVDTELAKYNYSLKMYEVTTQRQRYLDDLKRQRGGIRSHEVGKLQDNTNRILLLMSQMEIDRQQQQTYMDAYVARIGYLQEASKTLSQQALDGKGNASGGPGGGLGGIIGGAVGIGTLKIALDAAQSRRRN